MANIRLYQIECDLDTERDYKFQSLDNMLKRNNGKVKEEIYRKVFEGELMVDDLSTIFTLFNVGEKPDGYSGHSMSLSDVVVVGKKAYYTDRYYFKDIKFDEKKAVQLNWKIGKAGMHGFLCLGNGEPINQWYMDGDWAIDGYETRGVWVREIDGTYVAEALCNAEVYSLDEDVEYEQMDWEEVLEANSMSEIERHLKKLDHPARIATISEMEI